MLPIGNAPSSAGARCLPVAIPPRMAAPFAAIAGTAIGGSSTRAVACSRRPARSGSVPSCPTSAGARPSCWELSTTSIPEPTSPSSDVGSGRVTHIGTGTLCVPAGTWASRFCTRRPWRELASFASSSSGRDWSVRTASSAGTTSIKGGLSEAWSSLRASDSTASASVIPAGSTLPSSIGALAPSSVTAAFSGSPARPFLPRFRERRRSRTSSALASPACATGT